MSLGRQASGMVLRQHRPDYLIVLYMGLLMLLGLIVMYAIGPQQAMIKNSVYGSDFSSMHFFIRQSISLGLSLAAFVVFARIPYGIMKKYAPAILLMGFAGCMLLAVSGWLNLPIATCTLGACRWFSFGALSIQPAEFLKFGILIFMAAFLGSRVASGQVNNFEKTIIPFSIIMAAAAFFVVILQNDLGTGLSLATIAGAMLVMAGLDLRTGGILLGIGVLMIILSIAIAPHRIQRVVTFFGNDDSTSAQDAGYHVKNAGIAIGTGGLVGVGIGNSVQATGYLPEAINDSVFAIIGETFGFVGLVIVLALFTGLLLRLLRMTNYLADPWMRLVAAGLFGWLIAHVFLNVSGMVGIAPLKGITLPLLSFGGTSMVFIVSALGLAFQLSKYTSHNIVGNKEEQNESSSSRRGIRRTRYASSRSNSRA